MNNATQRAPLRYREDERISDRYRVVRELGGGGYSVVYEAYDEFLDELVALKMFAPNYGFDPARREIQALRRLSHPNVVQVIDVGRVDTDPPQYYMKLELLSGRTLRDVLDEDGPLSPKDVRLVGCNVLSALSNIHPNSRRIAELKSRDDLGPDEFTELQALESTGVVHRDIKPYREALTTAR